MYYVYILFSQSTDRYYTGSTNNLERRIQQHNSGYSKYTKHGIPWKIVYVEEFNDRSSAMKREMEIKSKKSRTYIDKIVLLGERPE